MKTRVAALIAALTILPGMAAQAGAAPYTFQVLAATGDVIGGKTLTGFTQFPVVNDNGLAAFVANFSGGQGIFTQSNFLVQIGDLIGGNALTNIDSSPFLNNNGDLLFRGRTTGTAPHVLTPNSVVVAPGDVIDGKTLAATNGTPMINDNGDIVFEGSFFGGIGSGTSTPTKRLVGVFDVIDAKTIGGFASSVGAQPFLNNNGDVAYTFLFFGGTKGILLHDITLSQSSILVEEGDIIDGKTLTNIGGPSLNDNNLVAFHSDFAGGRGIFTQNGLLVKNGDTVGGATLSGVIGNPVINNAGEVAFGGFISGGGSGIFTQNSLIARSFDMIDGKFVLFFGGFPFINNNGDVIFRANFTDGSSAIILATLSDNQPPDCSAAAASLGEIWPPNHKMVNVDILDVTDPEGDPVTITITGITQDEPVEDAGDGNFEPDGAGVSTSTAQVRAERQGGKGKGKGGSGNGRVYEISFIATDDKGATCPGQVSVCVPHDQGKKGGTCIDDGQNYNSVTGEPAAKRVVNGGNINSDRLQDLVQGIDGAPNVWFATETHENLAFELYQNSPNPFNPSTTIRYTLAEASQVRLSVYNVLGQEIRVLVNAGQAAGSHNAVWDGRDAFGREVSTGLYLYRLKAGQHVAVNKMVLAK